MSEAIVLTMCTVSNLLVVIAMLIVIVSIVRRSR